MRDFRPRLPADGLGLPPSGLLRGFFGEKEWEPPAARTAVLQSDSARPRHARDLVQSRPGGRTCKVPTCTCGRRGRLPRCCFVCGFFSFPLPLGSGGLNHLANDQQVGRCPSGRRVGRASASE